jgi:hypothetical protein
MPLRTLDCLRLGHERLLLQIVDRVPEPLGGSVSTRPELDNGRLCLIRDEFWTGMTWLITPFVKS